jgi:hypothetical protein|tara:strand:- start:1604 stop:2230 length:627 start_codon:yes stop_codon:yes gene_type:complete
MPQQIPNTGANARTLDTFKSKMLGGGVRPNFFECELKFPNIGIDDNDVSDKVRFLVKGANLPASNIAPISVPFRGRELKIAGERTFDTWTVTVMNDSNFTLRDAFEKWMNLINRVSDNGGEVDPNIYQQEAYVHQLGRAPVTASSSVPVTTGNTVPILRSYKFHGVFPTQVAPIELSYDQNNVIEEFAVELQVQWWEALDADGRVVVG